MTSRALYDGALTSMLVRRRVRCRCMEDRRAQAPPYQDQACYHPPGPPSLLRDHVADVYGCGRKLVWMRYPTSCEWRN
jgi:hypothetical protein